LSCVSCGFFFFRCTFILAGNKRDRNENSQNKAAVVLKAHKSFFNCLKNEAFAQGGIATKTMKKLK
jgi:hypothetical protein